MQERRAIFAESKKNSEEAQRISSEAMEKVNDMFFSGLIDEETANEFQRYIAQEKNKNNRLGLVLFSFKLDILKKELTEPEKPKLSEEEKQSQYEEYSQQAGSRRRFQTPSSEVFTDKQRKRMAAESKASAMYQHELKEKAEDVRS